jgi:hypothetical protein
VAGIFFPATNAGPEEWRGVFGNRRRKTKKPTGSYDFTSAPPATQIRLMTLRLCHPPGLFVVSWTGEEYDVFKSEIPVGCATAVRGARKASVVLVVFDLEKAIRVCQAAGPIPEFPGVAARATGEKGSRSCIN